jgi:elongation factor Ts
MLIDSGFGLPFMMWGGGDGSSDFTNGPGPSGGFLSSTPMRSTSILSLVGPAPCLRYASRRTLHTTSRLSQSPSSPPTELKVPIALIAQLRKTRPVPMQLARTALSQNANNLQKALQWLESHSPSAKAEKLSSRTTSEGTIAISNLGGKRVSMIHLACETDFVARNEVFVGTAKGVAGTAAFLDVPGLTEEDRDKAKTLGQPREFPVDALLSAPLIGVSAEGSPLPNADGTTIQQALLSSLSSTGENLKLLRAISYAAPFPSNPVVRFVPGTYAHGGTGTEGRVGGLVVLSVKSQDTAKPMATLIHGPGGDKLDEGLNKLARDIARQVVGFPTKSIEKKVGVEEEETLLEQSFMMVGESDKVRDVLKRWGDKRGVCVTIVDMQRWSVGDDLCGGKEQV